MNIIERKNKVRAGLCLIALSFAHTGAAHEMPEFFTATRIELDAGKTGDSTTRSWDADGWMGSDFNRLAWKTEGDVADGETHEAEAQLLYSRYVAPFWDFQIGARHDFEPSAHNYLAIGMRGLAPYGFEIDIAAFVRSDGKLFARTDFEYDLLITNRLIASPFLFADWAASGERDEDDIKGGLYALEAGLNVRYEFARTFAPYVEVARSVNPGTNDEGDYTITRVGVRLLF